MKYKHCQIMWGFIFITPTLILLGIFSIAPALISFYYSFTFYDLLDKPLFIGLENFINVFHDEVFYQTSFNTLFYAIGVPVGIFLALVLAVMLNNKKLKFSYFYRTLYFLPVILPLITLGVVWTWLFNTEYGAVNQILSYIGLGKIAWLTSYDWSKPAILITSIWAGFGLSVVILIGGLQNIPTEVYEAAKIDGAGSTSTFFRITIPLLIPTISLVSIMSFIATFQVFDLVMALTEGGPGRSSMSIVQYIYDTAFKSFDMGYASALSVILFIELLIFSIFQFKLSEKLKN